MHNLGHMFILVVGYLLLAAYIINLIIQKQRYDKRRNAIPLRIHVNGIRGKSTVTRYVAGILRDNGLHTYGKTTGTAARVIMPTGEDRIVPRRGLPNVNEQTGVISSFAADKADAIVMECMAINPDYQDWLENKVMQSHIVIITNVRLDHQEEMGYGLLDIARSLARSIPRNSILITAETNKRVLTILRDACRQKNTRMVVAKSHAINAGDLKTFNHVAHAQNVAIGLSVAKILGMDKAKALASMALAPADPGAFTIKTFRLAGKTVRWANLFAVNDKESFAEISDGLSNEFGDHHRIALLNNRIDRPSRVKMFGRLAQNKLKADAIMALGDYELQVQQVVNTKKSDLILMGNTSIHAQSSGKELLETALTTANQEKVLLVGAANIHSQQSEEILDFIAKATGETTHDDPLPVFRAIRRHSPSLIATTAAAIGGGVRTITEMRNVVK